MPVDVQWVRDLLVPQYEREEALLMWQWMVLPSTWRPDGQRVQHSKANFYTRTDANANSSANAKAC